MDEDFHKNNTSPTVKHGDGFDHAVGLCCSQWCSHWRKEEWIQ